MIFGNPVMIWLIPETTIYNIDFVIHFTRCQGYSFSTPLFYTLRKMLFAKIPKKMHFRFTAAEQAI